MYSQVKTIAGNIVDIIHRSIYPGTLKIKGGRIVEIIRDIQQYQTYIIPGFVDAHIHIESSMLVPSEFARIAAIHGSVAAVSDPHEIANIMGMPGIRYMIEDGRTTPFKFYFGAPSCVPATDFETSGATISPENIEELFKNNEAHFLSEVMNYPGVLAQEPGIMKKIALAKTYHKAIDGHAPGLKGIDLEKYLGAGIKTDHETLNLDEALEKLSAGINIQIRHGSATSNLEALNGLIDQYPEQCMFCSDDKHPDDLVNNHVNYMVKRSLTLGLDKFNVLRCASHNPIRHYSLDVGLLQTGDPADFVVIDNFENFNICMTCIDGFKIAENGKPLLNCRKPGTINSFAACKKSPEDFRIRCKGGRINIIEAFDSQLVTGRIQAQAKIEDTFCVSDPLRDILKITVVNRYRDASPAVGFIKNFGLKQGAIAASIAHDSHNIVAVGVSDEHLCAAVNQIIEHKGGIAVACDNFQKILPLSIAGIMSDDDGFQVAKAYDELNTLAKKLGSPLKAPFMTLSFMSLLVIPELKMSDKGLFDSQKFQFVAVCQP